LYIVDAHTSDDIVRYLEDDGLRDVKGFISEGKLLFFQSQDTYLKGGYFNPDRMIGTLEAEQAKAVAEGSSALRVTGEMTWVLQKLGGCERLIEYEIKLNKFFPGSRALAICQYDWHKFSPDVLLNVLSTHPVAIIGEEIFKNVYYIPPE